MTWGEFIYWSTDDLQRFDAPRKRWTRGWTACSAIGILENIDCSRISFSLGSAWYQFCDVCLVACTLEIPRFQIALGTQFACACTVVTVLSRRHDICDTALAYGYWLEWTGENLLTNFRIWKTFGVALRKSCKCSLRDYNLKPLATAVQIARHGRGKKTNSDARWTGNNTKCSKQNLSRVMRNGICPRYRVRVMKTKKTTKHKRGASGRKKPLNQKVGKPYMNKEGGKWLRSKREDIRVVGFALS